MKTKLSILLITTLIASQFTMAQWNQVGDRLFGDGIGGNTFFGSEIVMNASGTYMAVSDPFRPLFGSTEPSLIRIYKTNNDGIWELDGTIGNNDPGSGDEWGDSMSMSDDGMILAIGTPRNSTPADFLGRASVYRRSASGWNQIGNDILNPSTEVFFGGSVSLSADGTILAVGNTRGNSGTGRVDTYRNVNDNWVSFGQALNGDTSLDSFGRSIAFSDDGNILAVGIPQPFGGKGKVRIYRNVNDIWSQIGSDIEGLDEAVRFGISVDLTGDGNTIAIGADSNEAAFALPYAEVYENQSDQWVRKGNRIDSDFFRTNFGGRVSISEDGNTLIIGAHRATVDFNDFDEIEGKGFVQIYNFASNDWNMVQQFNGDIDAGFYGDAIAINDDASKLAIGGPLWAVDFVSNSLGVVDTFTNTNLLSVAENELDVDINIYPNPFRDQIQIKLGEILENASVTITDINGRIIQNQSVSNQNNITLRPEISSGLYLLQLTGNGGKTANIKIIKN